MILLALLAAIVYWLAYCRLDHLPMKASVIKATSTGLLALASLTAHSFWPISLGLALGALGDLVISRPGPRAFLAGMAFFALGHLAYAAGFLWQGAENGFALPSMLPIVLGLMMLSLIASTEVWLAPHTGEQSGPVRAYCIVIGIMALACLTLPDHVGRNTLYVGVALFVIADVLLAFHLFVVQQGPIKNLLSLLLWPAYWLGQALILTGANTYWSQQPTLPF